MIGFSSGQVALYDCAQAKPMRNVSVCETAITAIAFRPDSPHNVLIASHKKLSQVLVSLTVASLETLQAYARSSKKATKKSLSLAAVKLSVVKNKQDKACVAQADKKGHLSVALISGGELSEPVWAHANAHTSGVQSIAASEGSNYLATCSATEASLWSLKSGADGGPAALLDEPSTGAHNAL